MRELWRRFTLDPLRWTLLAIAFGTFLSGILLAAAQRFVLDILSAPTATSDRVFFGIIGMFMAIVGGMLTQTLLQPPPSTIIVGWSALQKLGASVAMSLAVALSVFSYYGIALAAFDFCSAVLATAYLWRIRR
jgi:NAD/NADP transhydrogenase beta subunit